MFLYVLVGVYALLILPILIGIVAYTKIFNNARKEIAGTLYIDGREIYLELEDNVEWRDHSLVTLRVRTHKNQTLL